MRRLLAIAPLAAAFLLALAGSSAGGGSDGPSARGLHVATDGHSFHLFVPYLLPHLANAAGIPGHVTVRGAPVKAFEAGKEVDVLTTSPFSNVLAPDRRFNELVAKALKHNPAMRIMVQVSWLGSDHPKNQTKAGVTTDWNAATVERLREIHEPYLKNVRTQVEALNKQYGRQALFVVPVAQAAIVLRGKILAGQAPGLKAQAELFRDDRGHALAPLMALAAYCHFAVIYRRSPVGLPLSQALKAAKNPAWDEKLDRRLQELAWDAVLNEPLSGVKAPAPPRRQPLQKPADR